MSRRQLQRATMHTIATMIVKRQVPFWNAIRRWCP